ncbi:MAG: hypothetical protein WCD42_00905 [Rhizomicrobium sp.]
MLSLGLRADDIAAGYLQETFIPLAHPCHTFAQKLLDFWKDRPADGIIVGRDIPSRKIASLLSHITMWEPVAGGRDYQMRYMGETLRARYSGYVVGKLMSELLSPDLFAYQLDSFMQLASDDTAEVLDIAQSHNGCNYLHYEVVAFPVLPANAQGRWAVAGTFYF